MFLFTKQHEELVGIYASQLARHRCVDLFVHMMELRLNSRYSLQFQPILHLVYLPTPKEQKHYEDIVMCLIFYILDMIPLSLCFINHNSNFNLFFII